MYIRNFLLTIDIEGDHLSLPQSRASSVVPSSVPRVHRKFRFRIFKYWKMSDHNLLFRNSRIEHQSDCNTQCPMGHVHCIVQYNNLIFRNFRNLVYSSSIYI